MGKELGRRAESQLVSLSRSAVSLYFNHQPAMPPSTNKKRQGSPTRSSSASTSNKKAKSSSSNEPTSSAFTSALVSEEVAFPRGGGSGLTPFEFKEVLGEGRREADEAVRNEEQQEGKSVRFFLHSFLHCWLSRAVPFPSRFRRTYPHSHSFVCEPSFLPNSPPPPSYVRLKAERQKAQEASRVDDRRPGRCR